MKPRDIQYLGCRRDAIENASPAIDHEFLKMYYHYLKERNDVYIRKEVLKNPYPWTNDIIIRDNSFTCIKRWLDRTSKWLINNISNNPYLSYEEKVWRSILFRLYNKIETAKIIGISREDFWDNIDVSMDAIDGYPNDPYTRAYKVIRPKYAYRDISPAGHDCWKSSLMWYISTLRDKYNGNIPKELYNNAESAIGWIKDNIDGVGNFIAYQIFVDLTYIKDYPISEEEFVISGPGCHAGLEFLFSDRDGLKDEELLFWLRNNIDRLFRELDSTYDVSKFFWYLKEDDRKWTVMDLENSHCEFSKYIYVSEGRHKRPRRYIRSDK